VWQWHEPQQLPGGLWHLPMSWFFWYVSGCILCLLLVYGLMRDTQRHNRLGAPTE
jgi:hypothetical protein